MHYKNLIRLVILLLMTITFSTAGTLTVLHGTEGQADSELKDLEKKFEDIGFSVAAKNEHLETHYYNKYHDKNLDLLNFYRIFDKENMRELLLNNPDFAAYTPFNFLAYKKLKDVEDGDKTWYGYLDSETMLNIIGEKDQSQREKFKGLFGKLDKLVLDQMKPKFTKKLEFEGKLPEKTLLKMTKDIDSDDIDDFVEEFVMKYDSLIANRNFVVAGFLDLKFEYEDMDMDFDKYDAFWVSSLCHFGFSNEVFNHGEPQAGVFAPCSIYFYILKDSKKLYVGYATVDNWLATTGITDEKKLKYMKKISKEVESIFGELGFAVEGRSSDKTIKANDNSDISELKSMIRNLTKEVKEIKILLKKNGGVIRSSKSIKKVKIDRPKLVIGDKSPEKLSAYYLAPTQSIDELKQKLKDSGFDVLAVTEVLKGKNVITITNKELQETNTFMATLNLSVGDEMIRVQNPSYFAAAYLGDKYHYGDFKDTVVSLKKALGELYISDELVEFNKLKEYTFMPELAHFSDFVELEEDRGLITRIGKDNVAYSLKLPNGTTLVGHKMRPRINKFLNKIDQSKNVQLLPYQSIVDSEKAYMMDPTFYLALSLPKLSMEEFMKIATTPDEIGRSIRKIYR